MFRHINNGYQMIQLINTLLSILFTYFHAIRGKETLWDYNCFVITAVMYSSADDCKFIVSTMNKTKCYLRGLQFS